MIGLDELKWGPDGLLPVITQDERSGQVLMQAWASREALAKTLETGLAHYWSRSRGRLWLKGETSGHLQRIRAIRTDCDADSLLYVVEQEGVACHEGSYTCFTRLLTGAPGEGGQRLWEVLTKVEAVLRERKVSPSHGSYSASLFARGADAYCKKIGEEATEAILAVKNQDRANLAWEVADLWFHTLVALVDSGIGLAEVAEQLRSRQGKRRGEG
jgi:phosphoribosyl-ATP pyrophosphohydrolase/phosphoribosyl-AMP cyclohydrolase